MNLSNIAKCEVKNLRTDTITTLDKFYENKNCAIIFFRRWGCQLCRLYAKELSDVIPILKKHDIDMVGIGFEELGSKDFVDGKFFDGELYLDNNDKQLYKAMEFKRFNYLTILASLLWSDSRAAIAKSRKLNVAGNLAGDGLQTGGALLIKKGGEVIYEFKQNGPADHVPNSKILEMFGLQNEIPNLPKSTDDAKPVCADTESTK